MRKRKKDNQFWANIKSRTQTIKLWSSNYGTAKAIYLVAMLELGAMPTKNQKCFLPTCCRAEAVKNEMLNVKQSNMYKYIDELRWFICSRQLWLWLTWDTQAYRTCKIPSSTSPISKTLVNLESHWYSGIWNSSPNKSE